MEGEAIGRAEASLKIITSACGVFFIRFAKANKNIFASLISLQQQQHLLHPHPQYLAPGIAEESVSARRGWIRVKRTGVALGGCGENGKIHQKMMN